MCARCVLNLCDHHFVPHIGNTQWCTCTCSVLNPYDTHFVPYIGGIQWCTCTGSILNTMCDKHSVADIGSVQWRMCTCSLFKLCDAHCVPRIEFEPPSGADAPDLPERKSVEASSGARVPALIFRALSMPATNFPLAKPPKKGTGNCNQLLALPCLRFPFVGSHQSSTHKRIRKIVANRWQPPSSENC